MLRLTGAVELLVLADEFVTGVELHPIRYKRNNPTTGERERLKQSRRIGNLPKQSKLFLKALPTTVGVRAHHSLASNFQAKTTFLEAQLLAHRSLFCIN